ncbi:MULTISPECIES: DUF3306 domain-containing protein [Halomonas]|uniref:Uncharacterized protein DUF3306 n=1 Tax=Halomonas ventosae TaxID=229007 RepID=A0A4R6HY59_9GAMM|nr:DUF3306 domain-containing protein [Halomonas ventosae]TDO13814.1 uncharacterized protein DUF3306 [Halomonas ventosae]
MSRFERWSRLKRGDTTQCDAPRSDTSPQDGESRKAETPQEEASTPAPSTRELTPPAAPPPGSLDHTLPDPDTLPAGSDIKAYLADGVSSGLRKRALRRLFAAEHYGLRDGLNDYDDDFRKKLTPLASEVAERLRDWTRQPWSEDQAPHDDQTPQETASEELASRGGDTDESSLGTSRPASQSDADTDEIPSSKSGTTDERST